MGDIGTRGPGEIRGRVVLRERSWRGSIAQERSLLGKVCRDLTIEPCKLHQPRHSVATAMISAAVPLGDVAKYLGDTVQTVVATYLHATGGRPGEHSRSAVRGARDGRGRGRVR